MRTLILRLTRPIWHLHVSRILCRAYERRVINSRQFHVLHDMIDQRHLRKEKGAKSS